MSLAISAEKVNKSYGKLKVLSSLDLNVRKGHIYGLLGPSGCGKTTLLKCVIGFLSVDGGTVKVNGKKPGTVDSGVPGNTIGYMPQELALYNEFSISQTLSFFGRVQGMTMKSIKERIQFLVDFLDLPSANRRIDQLSGGQKRRVSLAVALLHSPPVLILDEPTVGVDPVLRQKIWDHMLSIAKTSQTTIIITTHYVEEARQADRVGLMRSGRILAGGPPDALLENYKMDSLENVFLHLCMKDDTVAGNSNSFTEYQYTDDVPILNLSDDDDYLLHSEEFSSHSSNSLAHINQHYEQEETTNKCKLCCKKFVQFLPKPRNMMALVIKDVTLLSKKIVFLLFQFLLPAVQMSLFALCIGGKPQDLGVGVVNLDKLGLANKYLDGLSNNSSGVFHLDKNYKSTNSCIEDIKHGKIWGCLYFEESFTVDTIHRFTEPPMNVTPDIQEGSTIKVWLDMTNQQISMAIIDGLTQTLESLPHILSIPRIENISLVPLQFESPVYGSMNPSFLQYMTPGIILSMIFFMATGLTALSFVLEKKEGLLERTLVSGVNMIEIMIGHVLTQFICLIIQVAVLLICAFLIFKIENDGSLPLIVILTLFQGFTGMALGLLISAVSRDEMTATQLALAVIYPILLISGIIWPVEAMPEVMRKISMVMPLTLSAKAFRCIMARGWDLYVFEVWSGFLIVLGWGWGFCVIAAIIIVLKGA